MERPGKGRASWIRTQERLDAAGDIWRRQEANLARIRGGAGMQQPTSTGMEMGCNSHGPRHFVRSYVFLFLTTLLIERNAEGYLGEKLFEISRIHTKNRGLIRLEILLSKIWILEI